MSSKILVTAFEPFGGETINPSALLLDHFRNLPEVETVLLPVTFEQVFSVLEQHLRRQSYDFILCLGQAGGRAKINFERFAMNMMDSSAADEAGALLQEREILKGAPVGYQTLFSLREVTRALHEQGHAVEVSNSAGLFVCNYVYYRVLSWLEQNDRHTKAVFIHIPYCREQITNKQPGTPFMELIDMQKCIVDFINQCKALGAIK